MATVRNFVEDDIPAVAALFERAYPDQHWASAAAREAYFREILFDNPWHDLDLPSWVAEENGRMAGFAGVMPRRMVFRGRPIRVAVGCQFMVDPNRRHGLTALQLERRQTVAPVRVHHELAAHGDADRATAEHHPPWHHPRETGHAAVFLGDPRGQIEVVPRVIEEYFSEIGFARGRGGPMLIRVRALEERGDSGDIVLDKVADRRHCSSVARQRRPRALHARSSVTLGWDSVFPVLPFEGSEEDCCAATSRAIRPRVRRLSRSMFSTAICTPKRRSICRSSSTS